MPLLTCAKANSLLEAAAGILGGVYQFSEKSDTIQLPQVDSETLCLAYNLRNTNF